ncbi:hypothetical protein [Varibaculum sp.]|uniref:hypothetical protein n=1 Tax=Varibaculum sp. TaxID=1895474 RepID=UPI0025ECB98F|nr:hypothetical protein [Varibaculum sp.]
MLKKVFLSVFVVGLVSAFCLGYGMLNLKKNSVYYAQHTPHSEGVEPVLMEVTSNLDSIYTPDIKGIKYDYDGNNIIYNTDSNGKTAAFSYYSSELYRYYDKGDVTYVFDGNFKIVRIFDDENLEYLSKPVDVSAVKRDIYRTVKPVVDAQSEPFINLKWIYDWVNKDRFN